MTTQPDPNRHEASRTAFEAPYTSESEYVCDRLPDGQYRDMYFQNRWIIWTRALDWRDEQVCEWTRTDCFADGSYILQSGGDKEPHSIVPAVTGAFNFCPGCGRRVKIQTNDKDLARRALDSE